MPDLYFALRKFGADPITEELSEYDYDSREVIVSTGTFAGIEAEAIDAVWAVYGSWTGPELIKLTHESGGPWDKARKRSNRVRNPRIDRDDMRVWCGDQLGVAEAA